MSQLIRFELEKLLQKKIVWVALACMVLFIFTMVYNWIAPGYCEVVEPVNGVLTSMEGKAAVERNQEISRQYEGPLTNEKVQEIIESFTWSDEILENSDLKAKYPAHYTHNILYNTFDNDFVDYTEGKYNETDITAVYGEIAPNLIVGYSEGWEGMLYATSYLFFFWGCALIVILAPIFAEEYTRGTDALILTSSLGKTKCGTAKVIAAMIVAVCSSLIIFLSAVIPFLLYHGLDGYKASVQLSLMEFMSRTPYVISWSGAFVLACLLWTVAILVLTAVTLFISSVAKSAFTGLVIAFAVYMIPMFLPWKYWGLETFSAFLPVNQTQLSALSLPLLNVGGQQINIVWLTIPVTLIVLIICIFFSKKSFSKHQVL